MRLFRLLSLLRANSCLRQSFPSVLVLDLETDFVIQSCTQMVGRHDATALACLARMSVHKSVRRSGESLLLGLEARCILRMLEVNEGIAEVGLGAESCCHFQC